MEQNTSTRGAAAIQWMAILLFLVAGALTYVVITRQPPEAQTASQPAVVAPRTVIEREDLTAKELQGTELFQKLSPSVVHITSIRQRASALAADVVEVPQGTGSGFVWDATGHIVTNYHVVENAHYAEVTLADARTFRARVLKIAAPEKDLAVLKMEKPPNDLIPIPVGKSVDLLVGQRVFAIGSPFGLGQTLTTGIISALGREIESRTRRPIYDMIQTDAAINRGNSGGPLLDSSGRLIGVNTAIYNPSGDSWTGIGFAIPVDTVNRIVPHLIAGKGAPVLGIEVATDADAKRLGVSGVIVVRVRPKGPAAKTDLQGLQSIPGRRAILGDIIVGFDGVPVSDRSDLYRQIDKHVAGDTVTLNVERAGKKRNVKITLRARR